MKNSHRLACLLIATIISLCSQAQTSKKERDYKPAPYAFIGLQGGAIRTFTNSALDRKWAPMGALSVGGYATNWIGARLQGYAWTWDEDFLNRTGTYNTKQYGGDIDLLLNFTGLFFPNRHNMVNIVAVAGYGLQYAKFDTTPTSHKYPLSEKGNRWMRGGKLGGQIDLNIARHFGIQLEGGYRLMHDHIHGFKVEKWCPYMLAGINFKFGHPKANRVSLLSTSVAADALDANSANMGTAQPMVEEKKPDPAPVVVAETKKPEPKAEEPKHAEQQQTLKAPERQINNVFFTIGSANISSEQGRTVDQIVQWAKAHPEALIMLTGYADRQTGNADVNMRISEQRVQVVKKALISHGIAPKRITTDAKGDTVQPYAENDQNRAVIIVSETK